MFVFDLLLKLISLVILKLSYYIFEAFEIPMNVLPSIFTSLAHNSSILPAFFGSGETRVEDQPGPEQ